jgi:lipoprotein-anchoring transpeptidase ErfK/SrfK
MISRRHFLAATAAGLAAPSIASAQAFQIDPIYRPQNVRIKSDVVPGQILILPRAHFLYHVTQPGVARRYGVGVGRAGLEFTGTAEISVKKEWPTWRPTQEMIAREPKTYSKFVDNDYVQPGGADNPLGARAVSFSERTRHVFPHPRNDGASIDRAIRVKWLHPNAE